MGAMKRLLPLVLLILAACSGAAPPSDVAITEISGPMPALSGQALQGPTLSGADYRGHVVVVTFWATWCGPCRREQPELNAVQAAHDGVVFIGVNYRDDSAAARAYLKEFGVAYPSLSDPAGSLAYRFGVPYLPSTIVVDATGRMRYRVVGALDRATLDDLLSKVGASAS